MARVGRPPKISPEHRTVLVRLTQANPMISLRELQAALERETGVKAHEVTISKSLREAGVRRSTAGAVRVQAPARAKKRYGYTEAHRRQEPEQTYPSCLTDAEWALVEDLFGNAGGRGTPARYPRRMLVDACCYVVRTGAAWRMLPKGFPPWQYIYRTFPRWSAQGKFEAMHDRLRARWRAREGRAEEPTAAVLDAQSTRSSPQGREHGDDAGKKVKGRKRHLVVDTRREAVKNLAPAARATRRLRWRALARERRSFGSPMFSPQTPGLA